MPSARRANPLDAGQIGAVTCYRHPQRETYVRCINAEAEKDAASPTGAEDIAVAAHARCWGSWDAYRHAAITSFANGARTREERQLAHDKADAHLRQLELETRRGVVDAIVQRTLTRKR